MKLYLLKTQPSGFYQVVACEMADIDWTVTTEAYELGYAPAHLPPGQVLLHSLTEDNLKSNLKDNLRQVIPF